MFKVIDRVTGMEVGGGDLEQLVLEAQRAGEQWAAGLVYCDMEGFALLQDGSLVLLDECGNAAVCPPRYEVIL